LGAGLWNTNVPPGLWMTALGTMALIRPAVRAGIAPRSSQNRLSGINAHKKAGAYGMTP